jgi:uncharacterized protein (DUF1800 family)
MTDQEKMVMLWSRAGFGQPLAALQSRQRFNPNLHALLKAPEPAAIEPVSLEDYQAVNAKAMKAQGLGGQEIRLRQRSFRQRTAELGSAWIEEMIRSPHPLQEKMALFWHGHFATRADNPYFDQLLLQQFRVAGLGKFGTLLRAVAKSPGMLKFLNNQQNRKAHPNENFAREVMELFTLGRGNYTELDVKEAARAFTGWTFNEEGEFEIRQRQHDSGTKKFLGQEGAFGGDEILDLILKQEQTARFITRKIYRYFVNDIPDGARVNALAARFFRKDYDIGDLMEQIFTADWFYQPANRGAHVKSPVELLVGLHQQIPFSFEQDRSADMLLRVLGQQLFYPPNVAGWPGGRDWIDASSLVIRMRIPEAIFGDRELELRAKEIDAEMGERGKMAMAPDSGSEGRFKVGKADVDWQPFIDRWKMIGEADLPGKMAAFLIAVPLPEATIAAAVRYSSTSSKDAFIRTLAIRLMSLPEYQLA